MATESTRQRRRVLRLLTRERLKRVGKSVGSSAVQPSSAAIASRAAIIDCALGVAAPT
jgi:hypothetical protein